MAEKTNVTPESAELEAAKARIAELEKASAELEALKKAQAVEAEAIQAEAQADDPKRRVKVRLFKDNNKYKEPLYVSVNGYNAQVPRGVVVEVPFYVAKHIEEMQQQDENTAALIEIMAQDYEQKQGKMG